MANPMKFTVQKTRLKAAAQLAAAFTPSRTTIQSLTHVLIEAEPDGITLTATDLDTSIVHRVPADVDTPGRALLPASDLTRLAGALPDYDPISVALSTGHVAISSGRSRHKLPALPVEEFPQIPDKTETVVALSGAQLARLAALHAFASAEETRPILQGVLLEPGLRATSTNGHRLVRTNLGEGTLEEPVIVHAAALKRLAKVFPGGARVGTSDNWVSFSDDTTTITSRIVVGPYPNCDHLYNAASNSTVNVVADRQEFLAVAKRVGLATAESIAKKLRMDANGTLLLSAEGPDGRSASEPMDATITGTLAIGVDPDYLTEILGFLDGSEVELRMTAPERAILLTNAGEDATEILLMPTRLNDY